MVFVSPPGYLVPLSSPSWGQYGFTVLLVPSLPLLHAFSSPYTFASSSPSSSSLLWFRPVTLRLTCFFSDSPRFPHFLPFCGQPGHRVSILSPLSTLLHLPASSPLVKVFAQSGFYKNCQAASETSRPLRFLSVLHLNEVAMYPRWKATHKPPHDGRGNLHIHFYRK